MRTRTLCLLAICLIASVATAETPDGHLEANKETVRRFASLVNAADWDALETIVADDFQRHSAATAGPPVTSRDEFVELQKTFLVSFPDQKVTLETLVAEGEFVAALATYTATFTGPLGDIPPTGKAASVPFLSLFRFEEGRIQELWVEWDNLAMMTQLGLAPPSPAAE